jgi:hypothetical protein
MMTFTSNIASLLKRVQMYDLSLYEANDFQKKIKKYYLSSNRSLSELL